MAKRREAAEVLNDADSPAVSARAERRTSSPLQPPHRLRDIVGRERDREREEGGVQAGGGPPRGDRGEKVRGRVREVRPVSNASFFCPSFVSNETTSEKN